MNKEFKKRDKTDNKPVKSAFNSFPDEAGYLKVFDMVPIGIGMSELDGSVIYANTALQKMMGYSLDELKKINLAELYTVHADRLEMLKMLNEKGRIEDYLVTMKRRDGSVFVSMVNASLVERDGRKIILNTARDVTERKRAAEELMRSEKCFKQVVENMPAGAVICELNKISVNSYIEDLTGYSRDELSNPDTFFDILFKENAAKIEAVFSSSGGGDAPACLSVRMYTKGGGTRTVDLSKMHVEEHLDVWIFHDVTDYLFVQQKLMKSEAHLLKAQQIARIGSYECDIATGRIAWSEPCYEIMGVKSRKITFQLIKSLIHPDDLDNYYSRYFELFSKNAKFSVEYRVIRPDGKIIHIHDEAIIKYGENKRPLLCTGYYKDITERKNLENTLIDSEERYRMLFETSSLGVIYLDAEGRIVSANPATERIFGLTHDQIIMKTFHHPEWKSIHEDGSEFSIETYPAMLALNEGKTVHDIVMGVFNPQTKRFVWLNISAVPLFRQGETKPWQVYVIFEDITQKKENIDVLKRSELQKMLLIESAHEGYGATNVDRKITFINKRMCEITGYSREECIGKDPLSFFDGRLHKPVLSIFEKCTRGDKFSYNTELIHKDGHSIFVNITQAATFDENGRLNGFFALVNDFTKEKALESEVRSVRQELAERYSFKDIVGKSEALRLIFEMFPAIAEIDCNILLEGASGTGKNLFAKVIHNISNRKDRPFVIVNCGTLPENLLESELFGYVKGAFTGADRDKPGKFAAAESGVIFLDEIGELPLNLQVKLLRVIEEKQYEPIGSNTTVKSDVRIIAATNRDLKTLVDSGKFRADLYFRLKIVSIKIPSLKERPEDISVLVEYFMDYFNRKYNKNIVRFSKEAIEFFNLYDFPGNVRELKNMIEHAFIFCNSDILHLQHMPSEYKPIFEKLYNENISNEIPLRNSKQNLPEAERKSRNKNEDTDKKIILEAIIKCSNNKAAAARSLNMSYVTLWRKINKYGLNSYLEKLNSGGASGQPGQTSPLTDEEEKEILKKVLEKNGNNKTQAARSLNIDRTTLWRKLKKYGIL